MRSFLLKLLSIGLVCALMFSLSFTSGCANKNGQFEVVFIVDDEVYYSAKVNNNAIDNLPQEPTKEGYSFKGWYFSDGRSLTIESLSETPLSAKVYVYAYFDKNQEVKPGDDDYKQGSKIQRMNMVLEFRDESGKVTDTKTVGIELYLNFAPQTTKHFMQLAESGYYDGVCISNVYDKYLEFGEYTGTKTSEFTDNKKTASTVKGEFEDNGIVGNKLSSSSTGVLIMKRDADDEKETYYNSAKGTVVVTLNSASAAYPSKSYCVFGRITSDDADNNPKESYSDSTSVNRTGKSSLEIIKTVSDLASKTEDNVTTKTYYDSKEGAFYTYTKETDEDDSSVTETWYKGLGDSKTEITDKTVIEELGKKIDDEKYTFYTIPYAFVTIKSITKA